MEGKNGGAMDRKGRDGFGFTSILGSGSLVRSQAWPPMCQLEGGVYQGLVSDIPDEVLGTKETYLLQRNNGQGLRQGVEDKGEEERNKEGGQRTPG